MSSPCKMRAVLFCAALALCGCGSGTSVKKPEPQGARMTLLARMYGAATSSLHRPPRNEEELKKFIAGQQTKLAAMHIDSPDELFTSARDGKPIIIRYGTRPAGPGGEIVAYESNAVDGNRFVAFINGDAFPMEDSKFRELVPN